MMKKALPPPPHDGTGHAAETLAGEITPPMLEEGARVLTAFYRQPFNWLAEYHARQIFEAMILVRHSAKRLVQVIEIQRRFMDWELMRRARS